MADHENAPDGTARDYHDLSAPTSLSPFERQTLALQHQILAYLDANEADYHKRMAEVLTEGFTAEYSNVFSPYSELPYDDCRLLYDILDMFRVMKASIGELGETERDALLADHKFVLFFQASTATTPARARWPATSAISRPQTVGPT